MRRNKKLTNIIFTPNNPLPWCTADAHWINCLILQMVRFVSTKANFKQAINCELVMCTKCVSVFWSDNPACKRLNTCNSYIIHSGTRADYFHATAG